MTRQIAHRALNQALVVAGLIMAGAAPSPGQPSPAEPVSRPGLLWGGGLSQPEPEARDIDPRLPTGARREPWSRPPALSAATCSLQTPVCVHATRSESPERVRSFLKSLEQALAEVVGALRLPSPLPDSGLGPTAGLDVYLLPSTAEHAQAEPLTVHPDPRLGGDDRASAHCRVGPRATDPRRLATLCVVEALLIGVNAAGSPHLRRAIASDLWMRIGSPSPVDVQAIDDLQANPQLSVAGRDRYPLSEAAALLPSYLDKQLSASGPGSLSVALFQLSRGNTPSGQPEWANEPDAFDVLRQAFASSDESLGDFMLNFAVNRAFMGSRDNGQYNPSLVGLGNAGRVRFDWVIPVSSLPRRVAPRRPLEPLGATYLWLDLDQISLGTTLAFQAEWEAPVSFRWTIVAVDASGRQLKRYDLPHVDNATSAERTLIDHDGAVALMIVGTNMGGVDLAHPFDPDHEPWEPHGYTVYLAELKPDPRRPQ